MMKMLFVELITYMSKILIVPDVHGRKFWHKAIEMIDEVDQVVFLGDYLDPYSYEGITFEDALIELEGILAFKEDYPDKVVLLVGNHDMHYIKTEFMDCSRLNVWRRVEVHDLFMNNIDKFQLIHELDNYLFSHAGVYLEWTKKYEITLEELFDFKKFLYRREGRYREFWMPQPFNKGKIAGHYATRFLDGTWQVGIGTTNVDFICPLVLYRLDNDVVNIEHGGNGTAKTTLTVVELI